MNEEDRLTDRDMAIEGYGNTVKGVLPDGTVTGVMSYDGKLFKHYVETGCWETRHKYWEQDYEKTPLKDALEQFVAGDEMWTTEGSYRGVHYQKRPMESAGLSGWRYEYERKRAFRKAVLSGEITLPSPAIFNRYGNCYIDQRHIEQVEEAYWGFIEENYRHKHSHHSATKSKTAGD
jgi:hypothetical protein